MSYVCGRERMKFAGVDEVGHGSKSAPPFGGGETFFGTAFYAKGEHFFRSSCAVMFNLGENFPDDALRYFRGHEVIKRLGMSIAERVQNLLGDKLRVLFRLRQIRKFPQIGFVGSLCVLPRFCISFQGTVNVNGFFYILYYCILCV